MITLQVTCLTSSVQEAYTKLNTVGTPALFNCKGMSILFFHYRKGGTIPAAAYTADCIVCCNPQLLPEELKRKHPFPQWKGKVSSQRKGETIFLETFQEDYIN